MKFCLIVSLYLCACVRVITSFILILILILILARVTLHPRIANLLVMGSRCRGGIVNTRFVCSRALFVRRESPKALWRFRVSTANSPSGRTWLHPYTPIRYIDHTYVQQDIQVYEGDQI